MPWGTPRVPAGGRGGPGAPSPAAPAKEPMPQGARLETAGEGRGGTAGPAPVTCAGALGSGYTLGDPETCRVASGTLRTALGPRGSSSFAKRRVWDEGSPNPSSSRPRLEFASPPPSLAFDFLIQLFVPCGLPRVPPFSFPLGPCPGRALADFPVGGARVAGSREPGRAAGPRRGPRSMEMAREAGGRGGDLFRE